MNANFRRKVGFALILIGILGFGVYFRGQAGDFFVYGTAAKRILAGDYDLYRQGGLAFRYAPVIAMAFIPMSYLPSRVAVFLWYLLKIAALIAIVRMAASLMGLDKKLFGKVLGITLLAAGGYLIEEFRTGNIHFLVLFLIVLAFFQADRGRTVFPAFLLAIAICVKVTPFFLLFYFVLLKRWKLCLLCCLWLAVLILGPGFFAGWERNMETARHWVDSALARAEEPVNHSLKGVLLKYMSEKKIEAETEKYPRVNVLNLRPRMIQGLWLLMEAALFLFLIRALLQKGAGKDGTALTYALLIASLLIFSPHNSRIYFSALAFPCGILAAYGLKLPKNRDRTIILAVLGASFALNTLLPGLMPGRKAALLYETMSPYFFSALLVWIALQYLIFRAGRKAGSLPRLAPDQ
jgi:hypothetical protein